MPLLTRPHRVPLRNRAGLVVAYTLVDPVDLPMVRERRYWHRDGSGYAVHTDKAAQLPVAMHRAILGLERGSAEKGDHINRDRLDNRRRNLRVVTAAENAQNRRSRGGKSRHRGVTLYADGRWRAQVNLAGKRHHLGLFSDEDEAGRAASEFRKAHMPGAVD